MNRHRLDIQSDKAVTGILLVLLLSFFFGSIILGSVPPVDRDALTHHLFVPKLWLKHGSIYEIPETLFSYYPMNLDLLYMIPLSFGNDIVPKYIHCLFALLTALLIFRYLKKRLGTHYGLLGALFFLSIPIIVKLSITVYVDLGVVFFSTAALLLLLHWAEKDFQLRFLLLAGLCCGLAAGTKYNGLIAVVILILFVPIIYQQSATKEKQSNSKALLFGLVFAIATLTALSPWLIRNYAWTGNPIYPLHNSLFQRSTTADLDKQSVATEKISDTLPTLTRQGSNAFIGRKILYNETWWQTLLLPLRFFYEGKDDNPQFFDGKLTPFLLFLPALAFLIKAPSTRQHREQKILLWFAILYFFFTFFQEALRIRYIVPIVPPLVILSMYGLHNIFIAISDSKTTWIRLYFILLATSIPFVMLLYNTEYLSKQFQITQPLAYLRGKISRDQYISQFRPEYPAIQFTNTLPEPTRILAIFLGNRGYYFDKPVQFDIKDSRSLFSDTVKFAQTEHQISEILKKQNISHILIRIDLFKQWTEQQLNPIEKDRLRLFFRTGTKLIYEANGHGVFELI